MVSPLARAAGFVSPFSAVSVPSPPMVGCALVYLGIGLAPALRGFGRRDL